MICAVRILFSLLSSTVRCDTRRADGGACATARASRDEALEGVRSAPSVARLRPPCAEVEVARAVHAAKTAVRCLPHTRIAAWIDEEGALQLAIVLCVTRDKTWTKSNNMTLLGGANQIVSRIHTKCNAVVRLGVSTNNKQ